MKGAIRTLLAALCLFGSSATAGAEAQGSEWPTTEGEAGGGRYSPLRDIDRTNVAKLEPLWTYRHGDESTGGLLSPRPYFGTSGESTPILVGGRLFVTTPFNRVIALDPETGRELWTFDPKIDRAPGYANSLTNRGAAYWPDARRRAERGSEQAGTEASLCSERIFTATLDARLIALDAATGAICPGFGSDGEVNLRNGLEPLVDPAEVNVTSPPTVVGDAVIVGSSIADTLRGVGPPGDVRAFDARTGALLWTFHTIPKPGEPFADTWPEERPTTGHANVWSTITADLERGWVFLPVATANPDFYGGDRQGMNLFSDSVVAVDAKTGAYRWHFQTVHHDLWDYDLAAPPVLVRVAHGPEGREIDAVAQATKTGFVFLLDRETGRPLFPIEERPVPASDVPGEAAWPTQPYPTKPPPLVPQTLREEDLWDADPKRLEKCRAKLRSLRNEGLYTPPSIEGSVLYPFTGGGANWSGASFDPTTNRLFVPVRNLVHTIALHPLGDPTGKDATGRVISSRLGAIRWFVTGGGTGLRYWQDRQMLKVDDQPCNKPPWGMLVAVDLDPGTIAWSAPTGGRNGVKGIENAGPALVTAGGLVFLGGTRDKGLYAYDSETGEELARFELPAALHAGPVTYKLGPDSKQIVVVVPGGSAQMNTPTGDHVIAFALP